MPHKVHFPILEQIGLNSSEAMVYELLLENGRTPANVLVAPSGLGRGNVYNVLTSLKKRGLVVEIDGKKTVFEAAPPSALVDLLQQQRSQLDQVSASFEGILPLLASEYNLSTGKPTIQVFEGLAGAEQAISETLTSKTEILTYLDIDALSEPAFMAINQRYVKKRVAKKITKRIIVRDTQEAHAFFQKQNTPFTKVVFVPDFPSRFYTAMEIYDNTISYLTLDHNRQISVIVKDQHIYEMHAGQFEFLWKLFQHQPAGSASRRGSKTT